MVRAVVDDQKVVTVRLALPVTVPPKEERPPYAERPEERARRELEEIIKRHEEEMRALLEELRRREEELEKLKEERVKYEFPTIPIEEAAKIALLGVAVIGGAYAVKKLLEKKE